MEFFRNMNLPNKLTILRVIMIIPFVMAMLIGKAEGFLWDWLFFCSSAHPSPICSTERSQGKHLITNFGNVYGSPGR